MPKYTALLRGRALATSHRAGIAGVAALGAAALAISAAPSSAQTTTTTDEAATSSAPVSYSTHRIEDVKVRVTDQMAGQRLKAEAIEAKRQAADDAAAKKRDAAEARQDAAREAGKQAAAKAAHSRGGDGSASRSAHRPSAPAGKSYANNLDGWIRQSLDIMHKHGIPGSYSGLHRNIMRESSGNPHAINDWDINAVNGIPSKGLLQVIPPTFEAYHVAGTSWNIYDPVANITAACNYAAHRYGSMDNVDSAY
ncbi:transglycosylase SLT domain-containing protein [Streptomyces sp. NBC_00670]|jgi:hypothetical protein|uniref:transglycosylase SLT domain-containing protein n=1 Tax=Streptomyces sp. NBC_00670 TaxID=2975804 RepID=UPI002E367F5E|nr:transglycosylase SLT domain-containing protein [Streptomyces sp. NBC_00670]